MPIHFTKNTYHNLKSILISIGWKQKQILIKKNKFLTIKKASKTNLDLANQSNPRKPRNQQHKPQQKEGFSPPVSLSDKENIFPHQKPFHSLNTGEKSQNLNKANQKIQVVVAAVVDLLLSLLLYSLALVVELWLTTISMLWRRARWRCDLLLSPCCCW